MWQKIFIDPLDFFVKISAILLFIFLQLYWRLTEAKADREKPKTKKTTLKNYILRYFMAIFIMLFFFQLLGLTILTFQRNIYVEILGLMTVAVGISISVAARISLDVNWTHAVDYQIKKNHELITHGIYKFIRHPIYAGLIFAYTGFEIILQSYSFVLIFIILTIIAYLQGKREEKILLKHFGEKYKNYMKKTKMFFPYIF